MEKRTNPILAVKHLSVRFGENEIIRDVSFELAKGDNLTIIGPNGSGKTVLLRTLLSPFPHSGTIAWAEGVRIGYVPQKIEADRHLPVNAMDLLESKARILNLPKSEISAVQEAIGFSREAAETPIGHLSGGQFQKALIAFALLGRPNVVLLDEPTASIDQPGESQIYDLVRELQKEYNLSVVIVSHDLSMVYRYANKVLCLNRSNICFGNPRQVLTPGVLERLYGAPQKYYRHDHQ